VLVDLVAGAVRSWEVAAEGAEPMILWEEWDAAERIAKADPGFLAALARRGIDDPDRVFVDPLSPGNFGREEEAGRRLIRGLVYWREDGTDNGYAHPVEGLVPVIDLYDERVIQLLDEEHAPAIPVETGRYDTGTVAANWAPIRTDVKPLDIVQAEGVGFSLDGNILQWQGWRVVIQFHSREGLVLSQLSYDGRSILHRASLSEMVVPYGEPSEARYYQAPLDVGEYGIGKLTNSLELGCDCLGEIVYMDAVLADELGEPMTIKNAICLHEEDAGILWKHYDPRSRETDVRRSRKMVISSICTIGNYDYAFYWNLFQDGTIEHTVKATGIMHTRALADGETSRYAPLVAPNLGGTNHQHFFNYRLDFAVDGPRNTVVEVESTVLPMDEENRYGNAMATTERVLARESDAARDLNLATNRYWKVVNPEVCNRLGQPVSYKLMPAVNSTYLIHPESPLGRRAAFAGHHLWVTKYDDRERYASGEYPNQSDPRDLPGLPTFQRQDRGLENEDVVVWYSLGLTHTPRPEDWPIMPSDPMSFTIKPHGFFDRNPALNVPKPVGSHCCHQE
jgi:primary-amine oxidase